MLFVSEIGNIRKRGLVLCERGLLKDVRDSLK